MKILILIGVGVAIGIGIETEKHRIDKPITPPTTAFGTRSRVYPHKTT